MIPNTLPNHRRRRLFIATVMSPARDQLFRDHTFKSTSPGHFSAKNQGKNHGHIPPLAYLTSNRPPQVGRSSTRPVQCLCTKSYQTSFDSIIKVWGAVSQYISSQIHCQSLAASSFYCNNYIHRTTAMAAIFEPTPTTLLGCCSSIDFFCWIFGERSSLACALSTRSRPFLPPIFYTSRGSPHLTSPHSTPGHNQTWPCASG